MAYFVSSENNKAHAKVGLQSASLYSIRNNADEAGLFISSDDHWPVLSPSLSAV